MNDARFRRVFHKGTTLTEAWRACGVEIANPRNPPWHAYRPDGSIVLTVWRDHPDAGRWTQWDRGNFAVRLAPRLPGEIPGESALRIAKLEAHNEVIRQAALSQATIIVLVLNWRRDRDGKFVPAQRGASVPVEAWRAKIGVIVDGRKFAYSIVAIDQEGPFPMEGAP
jgi:hypothetical protein